MFFDELAFFKSVEESEKKATSEPDISAELNSNNKINTILISKEYESNSRVRLIRFIRVSNIYLMVDLKRQIIRKKMKFDDSL